MAKVRVYETTDHPVARQMLGYLLVRGGVHTLAYAKALEDLTGCDVKKMMPIPKINDADFKEAKPFVDRGLHARLYRFSPDDFKDIGAIWNGEHPYDGARLEVRDGLPEEQAGRMADPPEEPTISAPGFHPEELKEIAEKLLQHA
jgi:Mn-containing catalase